MRKNMKLTGLMAIVTVMALLIGTLAFFTDRVTANAEATTMSGAVDIVPVNPTDNTKEIDLTTYWGSVAGNATAKVNYNPGDRFDLSYDLKNKGELSVKTRETFVITSSVAMTDGAPEFALCTSTSAGTYGGYKASSSLATKVSSTVYKYTVENNTPMAPDSVVDKAYFVVFNENAGNNFQGAKCTVNYLVEALQSDGTWATVTTAAFNLGGQTVQAVPAA